MRIPPGVRAYQGALRAYQGSRDYIGRSREVSRVHWEATSVLYSAMRGLGTPLGLAGNTHGAWEALGK